jgi:hypothetical protein
MQKPLNNGNYILSDDSDMNSGGGPGAGLRMGPGMMQKNTQPTMIGGNIPVKK